MNPLEILLTGPYNLLYTGGFALAFGVAAVHGRRNGWPMLPWLTLLAACVAGGVAGSKLLHFDLHVAEAGEKTILGGLAGGMVAMLLSQRLLRFHGSTARALAPAALLGFALGRVGCFLAGCCFGIPTSLPWGVRYAEGTAPFRAQAAAGWIGASDAASLPVHPTQLYEAVLALVLALAIWRWGSRLRSAGAPALALAAGYGVIRFATEFVRAGAEAQLTYDLKTVQWTVLLTVLAAVAVLAWRERSAGTGARVGRARAARPLPVADDSTGALDSGLAPAVLAGLLATLLFGAGWFTPLEQTVLAAGLAPALGLLLCNVVRAAGPAAAPGMALATLALVPLLPDTVPGYPRSFFTAGVSGMAGEYETVYPRDSCGPTDVREHVYRVYGGSLGYTRATTSTESFSARARAYFGTNTTRRTGSPVTDVPIHGVGFTGSLDSHYVGVTGGIVAGDRISDAGDPDNGVGLVAGLRAGSLRSFFVTADHLDHEPGPYPDTRFKVAAGYGFGEHASNVRVGAWKSGVFLGGRLVLPQGLEIEPFLGTGDEKTRQFGLAVRQRF